MEGPGPGAYSAGKRRDGTNGTLADARGETGLGVFKSKAPQRAPVKHSDVPGPGMYAAGKNHKGENSTLADMRGEGEFSTMKSKSTQFTSVSGQPTSTARLPVTPLRDELTCSPRRISQDNLKVTTEPGVGPGSYAPMKSKTGANDTLADMSGENGSSAFESDMKRHLPW